MSGGPAADPAAIEAVAKQYAIKSAEELRQAISLQPGADAVPDAGEPGAAVLLVKGDAGPAEASGLPALSGPDGQAAASALEALGFDPDSVYAMVSRPHATTASPEAGSDTIASQIHERVRATAEAVDPHAIIALDLTAGADLAAAFGGVALTPGTAVRVLGRTLLVVEGLEASLGDPALKKRVWAQLRALKPAPAPW